jgi:hypothetical protein
MRELTVRIRFLSPSLGNVKLPAEDGRYAMPRNQGGQVLFPASWHRANMRFAAQVLGMHHKAVLKICWDVAVDGLVLASSTHRRFYRSRSNRLRFVVHEAFHAGQEVGLNCAVPAEIGDQDLWRLLSCAGRYRGLSPWRPGEYGFFEVAEIRQRNPPQEGADVPVTSLSQ